LLHVTPPAAQVIGDAGFAALALLMGSFMVSSFLSTGVIKWVGVVGAMRLGMAMEAGLPLVAPFVVRWPALRPLIFVGSCSTGFGGGILWPASGIYLQQLAEPASGRAGEINGDFFSWFSFNNLIGFGATALLLQAFSIEVVIWAAGGFALLSVAAFFVLVKPWPPPGVNHLAIASAEQPVAAAAEQTICGSLTAVLRMFGRRQALLMAPLAAACGNGEGLLWGTVAKQMGSKVGSYSFIGFAFGSMFGSRVGGRFSDRVGRVPVTLLAMLMVALGFSAFLLAQWEDAAVLSPEHEGSLFVQSLYVVTGTCFGMADLAAQSMGKAAIGLSYGTDQASIDAGYGHFYVVLGGATTAAYTYGSFFSNELQVAITIGLALLASVCFCFLPPDALAPTAPAAVETEAEPKP